MNTPKVHNSKSVLIQNWYKSDHLRAMLVAVLVLIPTASVGQPGRAVTDVEALVELGPRVTGTQARNQASTYLLEEYRQAGYVATVQEFSYPRFADLGSNLTVDGKAIAGRALNGSVAGKVTAPLVVVPNVGRVDDFAKVQVKGAIALVRRGEIRFLEKAENAAAAGAVGLVIVNTEPDNFFGTLGGTTKIPVLTLGGDQGKSLISRAQTGIEVDFSVNTQQQMVRGRNIIAHLPGVTQPSVLVGGHYDSVPGSPGANDNASGTAVVLEMARRSAETAIARQVWFVAFDGEEDGLHGSRAFVQTADKQLISGLKAMLNFDMVGVNDRLGVGGTPELTALAKDADTTISNLGSSSSGSDHASFAAADVPVLFFYRGQEPNYHTPNDTQVDPRLLDETVSVGLDVVKQLVAVDANTKAASSWLSPLAISQQPIILNSYCYISR